MVGEEKRRKSNHSRFPRSLLEQWRKPWVAYVVLLALIMWQYVKVSSALTRLTLRADRNANVQSELSIEVVQGFRDTVLTMRETLTEESKYREASLAKESRHLANIVKELQVANLRVLERVEESTRRVNVDLVLASLEQEARTLRADYRLKKAKWSVSFESKVLSMWMEKPMPNPSVERELLAEIRATEPLLAKEQARRRARAALRLVIGDVSVELVKCGELLKRARTARVEVELTSIEKKLFRTRRNTIEFEVQGLRTEVQHYVAQLNRILQIFGGEPRPTAGD